MYHFQNKIVMGGSDIESESENEYMSGPEIRYQQYMYNANMYNAMMQNMMPYIPMPCVPPYGYPVPYPPMLPNYPVNHPMAAGRYFEKGGKLRKNRRKVKSKGDDAKYYHRKHRAVSRHRYYPSSSESDREDERPETRAKRLPACRSVSLSHEIIADKSSHTLSHTNPVQSRSGVKPKTPSHNMPRMDFTPPSTPLHSHMVKSVQKVSADIAAEMPASQVSCDTADNSKSRIDSTQRASPENECHITAGSAAPLQKLPSNHPYIRNAVMTVNTCQQEELTLPVTNDGGDNIFAANDTVPLNHVAPHDVANITNNHLAVHTCSELHVPTNEAIDVMLTAQSASRESQPVHRIPRTATQMENLSALQVTLAAGTKTTDMTSYVSNTFITLDVTEDNQLAQSDDQTEATISRILDIDDVSIVRPDHGDSSTWVRPSNPDMDPIWRNATNSLKYLQSLHSLRKTGLEWETKYRPPPVSVCTGRGAGS